MKRRKRATYGSGSLSRPSMPTFPGWPSHNNLKKWSKARRKTEEQGIKLLMEYYASQHRSLSEFQVIRSLLERRSMNLSSLESEAEQLRALVLALAEQHVPFFKPKRTKRAAIDIYVLAHLLNSYQEEVKKGLGRRRARSKAQTAEGLRGKLEGVSDRRIQNLLAQARTTFKELVTAGSDGSITPAGKLEARVWQKLKSARPVNNDASISVEWSPNDADSIVVFGL